MLSRPLSCAKALKVVGGKSTSGRRSLAKRFTLPARLEAMLSLNDLLPQSSGWLPYWMILTSSAGIYMAIGNLVHPLHNKIIYTAKPDEVTPLAGRTSGTWTFTAAVVRLFCAYHISEPTIYHATIATYLIALFHFGSEYGIFKTANMGGGVISPLIVATTSLTWMFTQYDFYVKA